jgi:hypothetical protein
VRNTRVVPLLLPLAVVAATACASGADNQTRGSNADRPSDPVHTVSTVVGNSVEVQLDAPDELGAGRAFALAARVTNRGTEPIAVCRSALVGNVPKSWARPDHEVDWDWPVGDSDLGDLIISHEQFRVRGPSGQYGGDGECPADGSVGWVEVEPGDTEEEQFSWSVDEEWLPVATATLSIAPVVRHADGTIEVVQVTEDVPVDRGREPAFSALDARLAAEGHAELTTFLSDPAWEALSATLTDLDGTWVLEVRRRSAPGGYDEQLALLVLDDTSGEVLDYHTCELVDGPDRRQNC